MLEVNLSSFVAKQYKKNDGACSKKCIIKARPIITRICIVAWLNIVYYPSIRSNYFRFLSNTREFVIYIGSLICIIWAKVQDVSCLSVYSLTIHDDTGKGRHNVWVSDGIKMIVYLYSLFEQLYCSHWTLE